MRSSPDQLLAELLQLPTHVRARLAESLIASLDEDADVEYAWRSEVERRVSELDSGAATTRPSAEVFEEARARLRGR